MKNILVPTDFSPVADNAMAYAIELAAHLKGKVFLYHVYSFNKSNYDIAFPKDKQPYARELEEQMRRTKMRFDEKAREKAVPVRTFVEEDSFFSLFRTKAAGWGAELIIMGTKGATGITKFLFGSVASTALEIAEVPVLVVPPKYHFSSPAHIVLAIDGKQLAAEELFPLKKLALHFGARITLLNVRTVAKNHPGQIPDRFFDGVETSSREVSKSKSVVQSIDEFVENEGCDLLCMVRREKSFFENLFQKSITKVQVFNNRIPFLVLPKGLKEKPNV